MTGVQNFSYCHLTLNIKRGMSYLKIVTFLQDKAQPYHKNDCDFPHREDFLVLLKVGKHDSGLRKLFLESTLLNLSSGNCTDHDGATNPAAGFSSTTTPRRSSSARRSTCR